MSVETCELETCIMTEKILKWGKVVLICYCALFCLRFAQLNFGSDKMIAALYLPHNLVFDNAELMMRREDCLKDTVAFIKLVDLNGDLKKEFILDQSGFEFDYDIIYSIESNGTFRVIADFRTRDELPLYIPPLTIWGYPVILADDGSWGYGLNKWDRTKKCYVHKKETEKK